MSDPGEFCVPFVAGPGERRFTVGDVAAASRCEWDFLRRWSGLAGVGGDEFRAHVKLLGQQFSAAVAARYRRERRRYRENVRLGSEWVQDEVPFMLHSRAGWVVQLARYTAHARQGTRMRLAGYVFLAAHHGIDLAPQAQVLLATGATADLDCAELLARWEVALSRAVEVWREWAGRAFDEAMWRELRECGSCAECVRAAARFDDPIRVCGLGSGARERARAAGIFTRAQLVESAVRGGERSAASAESNAAPAGGSVSETSALPSALDLPPGLVFQAALQAAQDSLNSVSAASAQAEALPVGGTPLSLAPTLAPRTATTPFAPVASAPTSLAPNPLLPRPAASALAREARGDFAAAVPAPHLSPLSPLGAQPAPGALCPVAPPPGFTLVREHRAAYSLLYSLNPAALASLPAPAPGDVYLDFENNSLWEWNLENHDGMVFLGGVFSPHSPAPVSLANSANSPSPATASAPPSRRPAQTVTELALLSAPPPAVASERIPPGTEHGTFNAFWAYSRAGEARLLGALLDWLDLRLAAHPKLRIYHYSQQEKLYLRRLGARHLAHRERVEALLASGRFVDLQVFVAKGLRTGQGGYSLKDLEPLYAPAEWRAGIDSGAASVARFDALQRSGRLAVGRELAADEKETLAQIEHYNACDCYSTFLLHRWLWRHGAKESASQQI